MDQTTTTDKVLTFWQCQYCLDEVQTTIDEIAIIGVPMCVDCDQEMELMNKVVIT